jgi:hypothetical protein
MLTIRGPVQSQDPKPTYVYKEANWQYFQNLVNKNLNTTILSHNVTNAEIDNAVAQLTNVLAGRY